MTFSRRLSEMHWLSDSEFELDGVRYVNMDWGAKTDDRRLAVLKPRYYFDAYEEALRGQTIERMLEFGVFQGGSTMLMASLCQPRTIVAIDICDPVEAFDRFRERHPDLTKGMIVRYNTSQDDADALNRIFAEAFDGPIDLVIDDACHWYDETRRAFEIAFPLVKPGGVYVIEDWHWAHTPEFDIWHDKGSPVNLLTDLMLVQAARPELIDTIRISHGMAIVRKGVTAPVGEPLDIEAIRLLRGRPAPAL
jgi:predicted O-methyltransferase YrrM